MQDFESPHTETYDLNLPRSINVESPSDAEHTQSHPPQREGLPSHYRMRAERHYVDSISSGSAGVPIRLIPVSQFEPIPHDLDGSLDPLIKSIRVHGVIQPLLVRKRHTQYEVIAGRRRLAAAVALGLPEVPCVLHQVDDAGAAALSAAENVLAVQNQGSVRAVVGAQIAEAIARLADDVARLQTSLAVLRAAPEGFERVVAADLIAAQTARTAWLASTAALLAAGKYRSGRRRLLSAILDDLTRQFEPECRLTGLRLEVNNTAPAITLDDGFVAVALTGAVMMTLSLLDQVARPLVEITIQGLEGGGFAAQIAQRHVAASPDLTEGFASRIRSTWTPLTFALGALALAHATAAHGGAAELVALDETGSALQLTFCRV